MPATHQKLWPQSPEETERRKRSGTRVQRTDWVRSHAPQSDRVSPYSYHELTGSTGRVVPREQSLEV